MMKKIEPLLLILIIGAVLFIPFLGRVHLFDWDEINFAESAREMLLTQDFFRVQINFKPFWEKPPLFIWLQALSMKVFGITEFAARLPNALVGIITLMVIFLIGKRHYGNAFGWWWVLCYIGSFLPFLYFKSGIIDPLFNLFIFLGIYFLSQASVQEKENRRRFRGFVMAGICIGFAVLTKGPVALLIALLCMLVYSVVRRSFRLFTIKEAFIFLIPVVVIAFAWFGVETLKNGPWFLQEFIVYQIRLFRTQDAGHGGPFIYHWIVLYVGCFPASIFIFKSFKKNVGESLAQQSIKLWMIISFFVVLILFSIVKTKIVHYSSFCYFPLTFLAAYVIDRIASNQRKLSKSDYLQMGILGGLISLILFIVPLLLINIKKILPGYRHLIKDQFALANLEAKANWHGLEYLIGVFYFLALLMVIFSFLDDAKKLVLLFISTTIVINLTLLMVVPNIEIYSQGAAIEAFKSLEGQDAYVDVYGYKSYAQLFYTKKKPIPDSISIQQEFLLHGPVDKDVFLLSKITNTDLDRLSGFVKIREKNGFVLYYRKKSVSY